MSVEFTIQIRVPIDDRWVPIDEFSNHQLLLNHYFSCHCTEISSGGPWFQVNGRDWHNEGFLDTFLNASTWFTGGLDRLVDGDARVFVWAWEETNLYLERRGDTLILKDRGHHGTVFRRLKLPFFRFAQLMHEQGVKFFPLWSKLIDNIQQLKKQPPTGIPPQIVEACRKRWPEKSQTNLRAKRTLSQAINRRLRRLFSKSKNQTSADEFDFIPGFEWYASTNWYELADTDGDEETLEGLHQSLDKIGCWLEEQTSCERE